MIPVQLPLNKYYLPFIKYLPFRILLFFSFNLFIIVELLQFNAKAAFQAER